MTLDNIKLIDDTKNLVKKENEIHAEIIRNLITISERKLHLELGYGSLFEFCVQELGMSNACAQRRIDAVKLSQAVSDLPERIESGELSLNRVGQVAQFLRQEKRVVDRELSKAEVVDLVDEVQGQKQDFTVKKILNEKSKIVSKPVVEKAKYVGGGRQTLEIEVDDEFLEMLEQARQLLSHKGYQSKGQILKTALQFFLEKNHPQKKSEAIVFPRGSETKSKNPRYIPEKLRQLIWRKHQSCCAFVDPRTKKRCSSRFRLQIEHVIPVALGGTSVEENLTLLCQAHNLLAADKLGLLNKYKQQNLFS